MIQWVCGVPNRMHSQDSVTVGSKVDCAVAITTRTSMHRNTLASIDVYSRVANDMLTERYSSLLLSLQNNTENRFYIEHIDIHSTSPTDGVDRTDEGPSTVTLNKDDMPLHQEIESPHNELSREDDLHYHDEEFEDDELDLDVVDVEVGDMDGSEEMEAEEAVDNGDHYASDLHREYEGPLNTAIDNSVTQQSDVVASNHSPHSPSNVGGSAEKENLGYESLNEMNKQDEAMDLEHAIVEEEYEEQLEHVEEFMDMEGQHDEAHIPEEEERETEIDAGYEVNRNAYVFFLLYKSSNADNRGKPRNDEEELAAFFSAQLNSFGSFAAQGEGDEDLAPFLSLFIMQKVSRNFALIVYRKNLLAKLP